MARAKKSALAGAKYNKAIKKHRADETKMPGGGDLPPGIENGIAQLTECKFGTYEKGDMKGEPFFRAAGIVVAPEEISLGKSGMMKVQGLRTSIGPEPICDTPNRSRKTIDEHFDWVLNELRKLGAETEEVESGEEVEALAQELKESGVYFRFRTWQGEATKQYPNPRVNHVWGGVAEGFDEDIPDDVDDDTDDDEEPEEDEELEDDEEDEEDEEDEDEDEEPEFDPDEDINPHDAGELADDGHEDLAEKLTELAAEFELEPDDYPTWVELGDAIIEARKEVDEDDEEEEEDDEEDEDDDGDEFVPEKEEVYSYKPPRSRKSYDCEVTAVFPKAKTVNLKNHDNGKVYKGVSWDDLSED